MSGVERIVPERNPVRPNLVGIEQGMIQFFTVVKSLVKNEHIRRIGNGIVIRSCASNNRNIFDRLDRCIVSLYISRTKGRLQDNKVLTKTTSVGIGVALVVSDGVFRWIMP